MFRAFLERFSRFLPSDPDAKSGALGGLYMLLGEGYSNLLRFGSNLIMTRLLFPEAFGLMLVVNLAIAALEMVSTVGIRGALLSHKGELDNRILSTAWVMSMLRGLILMLACLGLAGPISAYYEEQALAAMLMVSSLIPLIRGLRSPYVITNEKELEFARVVIWTHIPPTISIVTTLIWLYLSPTIWALVAQGIVAAAISTGLSWKFFPGEKLKLRMYMEEFRAIFAFGRWAFFASIFTFLATRGDALIVSTWVTTAELGVFTVAMTLAGVLVAVLGKLSTSLLLPLYARVSQRSGKEFRRQLRRIKLLAWVVGAPPVLFMVAFGREIIAFLYDPRYTEAGWILEIAALGSMFSLVIIPLRAVALSQGDSLRHMWLSICQFILLYSLLSLGGSIAGLEGLIVAIAVTQLGYVFIYHMLLRKYEIGGFYFDMAGVLVFVGLSLLIWQIKGWPVFIDI